MTLVDLWEQVLPQWMEDAPDGGPRRAQPWWRPEGQFRRLALHLEPPL